MFSSSWNVGTVHNTKCLFRGGCLYVLMQRSCYTAEIAVLSLPVRKNKSTVLDEVALLGNLKMYQMYQAKGVILLWKSPYEWSLATKQSFIVEPQADGVRERLSEQQYNRLVDYITKTSCHLAPSCSSTQTPCPVVPVEPLPSTVKTYHYMADPPFAQVFISKFTMVKNRALRKGFPWVPSSEVLIPAGAIYFWVSKLWHLTWTPGQHFAAGTVTF